jgi:PAS domain S-box-containing protein
MSEEWEYIDIFEPLMNLFALPFLILGFIFVLFIYLNKKTASRAILALLLFGGCIFSIGEVLEVFFSEETLNALDELGDSFNIFLSSILLIMGFVVILEQKLKVSEQRFQHLFENSPNSVFLLELDGTIIDCNFVTELFFECKKDELKGKNIKNIILYFSESPVLLKERLNLMIKGKIKKSIDICFYKKDGTSFWGNLQLSLFKLGNESFLLAIMQDVSEKKLIEEMKKKSMEKASEELKSPLITIFDATDILLSKHKDNLDEDTIKLLDIIKKGGERSMSLVGNLVQLSNIDSDKFELKTQTESLTDIIREVVQDIDGKIKKQGITININTLSDLFAEVDKISITHVIKNILSKAINISSIDNKISILLREKNKNAELIIETSSFAVNIEKSQTGIGFSQDIIERHGGRIFNEPGKNGTNFVIQLPIKNWFESLIHIYIITYAGIPLCDYSFVGKSSQHDPTLISGGIIGLMTILKEIIQGQKQIRTIDHGDRVLIFETNKTSDIIFALLVKENLSIFKKKLTSFIEEFDKKYDALINRISESSADMDQWENVGILINEVFC